MLADPAALQLIRMTDSFLSEKSLAESNKRTQTQLVFGTNGNALLCSSKYL